jgi:hypothetical protein
LLPYHPIRHSINQKLIMTVGMSDEIPVGLYLLRRIRELGCKTVQGLPGTLL